MPIAGLPITLNTEVGWPLNADFKASLPFGQVPFLEHGDVKYVYILEPCSCDVTRAPCTFECVSYHLLLSVSMN